LKFKVLVCLCMIVTLLAACGGGPKPASPPPPLQESTKAPVQPTQPAVQPTQPPEEYGFGQSADLSKLNSYRAHYTWKWQSTKEGKTETGSWDIVEEFVKDKPARRIAWIGAGAAGGSGEGKLEFIQIGNESYMNTGGEWIAMTTSEQDIFKGNAFLTDPMGFVSGSRGKLVQKGVLVNGVSADHYAFDESSMGALMGLGAIAKAKGDVWLSPEFNIVVKYTVHYEGKDLVVTGGGEQGALDVALDITEINKPITIEPPTGVKPAMPEDIPVIEGATELTAVSGFVSYKTTKSVAEVTAFYEQAMPAKGWAKSEGGIEGMLSFTKGERKATVMIQSEEGKTTVTIMAGE